MAGLAAALVLAALCGCGRIADPDRIRIAKVDGNYITRGDLFKLIREMEDTERPKIRTRNDLLRVLNQHIDSSITIPLGKRLAEENKLQTSREAARERFFLESGDEQEQLRMMWEIEAPASGEITPLMKLYNLSPEIIRTTKVIIEQRTDKVLEKMRADEAVAYLAAVALQNGELSLDDADLEREYRLRHESLKKHEWMRFMAIRFQAAMEDALTQAAALRKRIDEGESFDAIVEAYLRRDSISVLRPAEQMATVMESEIENNPGMAKFRGFWVAASGAQPGDIIGPVYLPQYQQMTQDAQGRASVVDMPDAYLVLRVIELHPETEMTLEEAKPYLAPPILVAKQIQRLREEHGVEIYEDKLPDPAQIRDEFGDPVFSF